MIEFDLAAYLLTRTAVTDVIGSRIYANRAPQTTDANKRQARIVYTLSAGSVRHYHTQGASGLVEADIQLGIVAATYSAARDLYEIIRDEIDGFRGTWNGTTIDRATLTPPSNGSQEPTQGDDIGFPAVACTVQVFYQETIPALGT